MIHIAMSSADTCVCSLETVDMDTCQRTDLTGSQVELTNYSLGFLLSDS